MPEVTPIESQSPVVLPEVVAETTAGTTVSTQTQTPTPTPTPTDRPEPDAAGKTAAEVLQGLATSYGLKDRPLATTEDRAKVATEIWVKINQQVAATSPEEGKAFDSKAFQAATAAKAAFLEQLRQAGAPAGWNFGIGELAATPKGRESVSPIVTTTPQVNPAPAPPMLTVPAGANDGSTESSTQVPQAVPTQEADKASAADTSQIVKTASEDFGLRRAEKNRLMTIVAEEIKLAKQNTEKGKPEQEIFKQINLPAFRAVERESKALLAAFEKQSATVAPLEEKSEDARKLNGELAAEISMTKKHLEVVQAIIRGATLAQPGEGQPKPAP